VIGEGEKDEAPMLYNGEHVGSGQPPQVDLAVDPIDGTRLLAEGRPGAIAMIAVAPRGTMFDPGPCVYMMKWVVGAEATGVIDLDASVADNLNAIADAKRTSVSNLTVIMLDRPRHEELAAQVRDAGARLRLIMDGDVGAALLAMMPDRPFDVLLGIGGTPEGVATACAVKALRGEMVGRLWPRDDDERQRALDAGYDLEEQLTTDRLVTSDNTFFVCTGVTPGELCDGVTYSRHGATTESLVMRGRSGTVRYVQARHTTEKLDQYEVIAH
ncbi:MAG: class II fructose-bisphosphatase, partial [Actinobacteria bacterium]|nr:class II fructose-bisphosphatase [Actinomycetota bacterium]